MYADVADMVARFGEHDLRVLSARGPGKPVEIDTEAVNTALTDAAGRVDGYCRGRYDVPFNPPPPEIKRLTCDIARYFLYDQTRAIPEAVENAYKLALKILGDIAKGAVVLDVGGVAAISQAGKSKAYHPHRPLNFSGFRE